MFGISLPSVIVAVALAIVLAFGGGYVKGRSDGAAATTARYERALADERQRLKDEATKALAAVEVEAAAAATANGILAEQVASYEARLAKRGDAACVISPADGRELRAIR